jgi:hypothetical protein
VSGIFIHRPWLRHGGADRHLHFRSVVEKLISTLEGVVELREPAWCNDFDGGLESVESKFEPDMIVALAAMAYKGAVLLLSY